MGIYNKNAKNILKFVTPAEGFDGIWRQGLPTGNGKVGLMVYGGSGREVVVVNHTDLWWQGKTGVLPDVSDKVKNIAKNLASSNYREAETVLTNALNAKNYKPECAYPLPLCDLVFTSAVDGCVSDYFRALNLESGEIRTEFKCKNIKQTRDIFVSRVNDVICYEINCPKHLNGEFTIELHDKSNNRMPNYESFDIDLVGESKTDKDFVVFTCRNTDGTDFGCVAKVLCYGGVMTKNANKFFVKNADKVFIMAKTFVSGMKSQEVETIKESLNQLIKTPYEKFLKEHAALHSKFVNCTDINLNCNDFDNINTALLSMKTDGNVPLSLIEKLYMFGKHIYASCVGDKINSFGLFNGDYKAYRSTTENYMQLQRLYNFSYKANLAKTVRPIFDRFYENLDDYKKNSTRLFGCKGIFIPSLEAPESGLPGSSVPGVVMNYNVASYICSMIYQYFLQTEDIDFMTEKGFEIIEETALFYEDILRLNKNTNVFETTFGYSPFNTPTNIGVNDMCCVASNCTCDFACAKYVFEIIQHVCLLLNKDEKDIEKWQNLASKIADNEVDKNGYLKEYNGNIFETNHFSPYIPHLFPYNIGIKPMESRRDYEDLVSNSVKYRYSNCFGLFSSANLCDMAVTLATCGDAESSYEVLSTMIKNFITPNLIFSSGDNTGMGVGVYEPWTSFNIDKNLALLTCVQNMFINSNKNNIMLFRSLPQQFSKGNITNLILDDHIKADLEFNIKRGILKLKLKSNRNATVNIGLPNGFKKIKGVDQSKIDMQNLIINNASLQANKVTSYKIYFSNKN
ncbi:MAG: glycoside hydrolase N-terminal domain-containing protein [Clostridia bacterium]|nr:glycoside hydrolase N-terminal domain-containing protein [Clostridia bacterium]